MNPDQKLIRLLHDVRHAARQVESGFKDHHDHYVFEGSMNDVEWLRDAISDVEDYMIENDIEVPCDS